MLSLAIELYTYVVLAAVLMSWFNPDPSNPLVRIIHSLTEPVLKPIRAVLPNMMGLDFSALVLLIGLQLLQRFI
jgi:YggT family protein